MCLVAGYRQLASEYRRLAALLTRTDDKEALELFAIGWDKIADNHETIRAGRTGLLDRNTSRELPTGLLFVYMAGNDEAS
jgi:hypothetical protein